MKDIPQNPPIAGPAPDKELKDWKVYEVANSDLVVGMDHEPVVLTSLPSGGRSTRSVGASRGTRPAAPSRSMQDGWECTTAPWWVNRDELGTAYAQTGPERLAARRRRATSRRRSRARSRPCR